MCQSAIQDTGTIGIGLPFIGTYVQRVPVVPSDSIGTTQSNGTNRLYNSPFLASNVHISESLISVVQMPSRKKLDNIFGTAQYSVIGEK